MQCACVFVCRLLWSRSQHATGELFLALKRNQEEPEAAAAALVGLSPEAAAAALAVAAGAGADAAATITSATAMSSAAMQVRGVRYRFTWSVSLYMHAASVGSAGHTLRHVGQNSIPWARAHTRVCQPASPRFALWVARAYVLLHAGCCLTAGGVCGKPSSH